MPGRYIGKNTHLVYDLMQYTDEKKITGLWYRTMIHFEKKTFRFLSWKFIDTALEYLK